jgi:hypothetical protein
MESKGAKEWILLLLSNDEEATCPKRHEQSRRNKVVHHLTAKLFPQGHDRKQCSPFLWSLFLQICLLWISSSGGL